MISNGGGVIVNVAGTSGTSVLDPPFYSTCTGPAKAAEVRFTKAMASSACSSSCAGRPDLSGGRQHGSTFCRDGARTCRNFLYVRDHRNA